MEVTSSDSHEEKDDKGSPYLVCYLEYSCECGRVVRETGQEYINESGDLVSVETGIEVLSEGQFLP